MADQQSFKSSPRSHGLSVKAVSVTKSFRPASRHASPVVALQDFSLDITAGSFTAILGPSGCGKSTLLRMIAGLEKPTAGRIDLQGHATPDEPSAASDVAYVFQDAHLLPWRNIWRNAALPLELLGVAKSQRMQRAREALDRVGLGDALQRYPAELSGGMRMRVSLARALVTQPRLLLLDEPFAALDEITRQHLDDQLRTLWQQTGMTVIFVTHATAEAAYLAQRAVVLSPRPGRIVHDAMINLPTSRDASLRGQAAFARETATLYEALAHPEAVK